MNPQDIHLKFARHLIAGDLKGCAENCYTEDAVFIGENGEAQGREAIAVSLEQFLSVAKKMKPSGKTVHTDGDTALIQLDWEIEGSNERYQAVEVLKRNENGIWQYCIDKPFAIKHA